MGKRFYAVFAVLIAFFIGAGASAYATKEKKTYDVNPLTEAYCVRIIDGDTIEVKIAGEKKKVRMIGIDSPEKTKESIEFYAEEATAYAKKRLLDKTVYLEGDQTELDKYGRMLAYVWIKKPSKTVDHAFIRDNMFNAMSVKNGYSLAYEYKPDTKYLEEFLQLEYKAVEGKHGQWSPAEQKKWDKLVEAQNAPQNNNIATQQQYIGNKNTKKFHYPSCSSVNRMKDKNKVWINSRQEAVNWGYNPCKICNP